MGVREQLKKDVLLFLLLLLLSETIQQSVVCNKWDKPKGHGAKCVHQMPISVVYSILYCLNRMIFAKHSRRDTPIAW